MRDAWKIGRDGCGAQGHQHGHEADVVWGVKPHDLTVADYGMVLSHFELPPSVRQQLPGKVLGARRWTRAHQLNALSQAGF